MAVILFMMMLVSVIIASIVFYQRAKSLENQQQLPPGYGGAGGSFTPAGHLPAAHDTGAGRSIMNLKLNDIVSYYGTDYIVEGRLDFWEDGYTWITYMLVDGDMVMWLSAEEDDGLDLSLWEDAEDLHISQPIPEMVEYRGETFRMQERGKARVNQQGRTGNKNGLQVEYFEYKASSGELLSVEKWGGDVDVSVGREIRMDDLEIFPGDQVEY